MIWYYIDKVNKEHFRYDISHLENDNINYLYYPNDGYYKWHQDNSLFTNDDKQSTRKLSFSLLLSPPNDYTGGQLQFHYNNYGGTGVLSVPNERGNLIVFDSRLNHRVTPVKNGVRKVLVGWVTGPRWR
jgi:PKHD-type hydroxylase